MSTTITIAFTASPGGISLDGSKFYGPPADLMNSALRTTDPLAWIVANEFLNTGATSGSVVITAS